jgi:hypothetical protein
MPKNLSQYNSIYIVICQYKKAGFPAGESSPFNHFN